MLALPQDETFWRILDDVHARSRGDMDRKCELLEATLGALDDDALRSFAVNFRAALDALYTWDLWGAAYLLNGGCSDDAFGDFRSTLLSLGEATCRAALRDANSLADVRFEGGDCCFEGFGYVVEELVEDRLGDDDPPRSPGPTGPAGEAWDEDDLPSRFPRLAGGSKPWWKFW